MLLRIPLRYGVKGTRGRATRTFNFQETFTIEVPEVSSHDAPVAVAWQADDSLEDFSVPKYFMGFTGHAGLDGLRLTRFFDGHHWLRLTEGARRAFDPPNQSPDLRRDAFEDGFPSGWGYQFLGLDDFRCDQPTRKTEGDPADGFVSVTDNGREKAIAALEKGATALLCVDGVFHMRCTQPVISLMQAGTTTRVSKTLHVETRREVVEGMPKVGKSNAILPLDQWDEAVDMVVRESGDRHETFRRLSRLRPVVHLPESIDPEFDRMVRADSFVREFTRMSNLVSIQVAANYFRQPDIAAKESFLCDLLAAHRVPWEADHYPVAYLDEALDILSGARVELSPLGLRPSI